NLKAKPTKEIPILCHNPSYDVCTFVRELHRLVKSNDTPFVINPSGEKIRYLSFPSVATFVDTIQFVHASLEKLVEEHKKSGEAFPCLEQYFGNNSEHLKRKGVFPYSFIDSFEAY